MKVIGERISILKKENLLSIVILPGADKRKLFLLFLWLVAWTVCGIIVGVNYFKLQDPKAKIFVMVYLSFWAYFEYRIARVFMWKRSGKEKLWIQNGIFHYQREINGRGKILELNLHLVSPMRLLELSPLSFADTINQSFWIKGGERLEFDAQAKTIRLGMQLSDEEARGVMKEVNGFLKTAEQRPQ